MLLSQANLKVHVAAAQRTRYALNTVVLSKKGSVSTDGRLVLFIPYPTIKPEDVPTITGVNAAAPAPWYPVLLRLEDAARAAAMVGKGKRGTAMPATDLIRAEVVGDKVVFGATDLSSPQVMTVNQVEGQWPDIGSVLPDHSKAMTITLDIDNMLRALKALRAASKDETVTLRIIDDQNGVSYSTSDGVAAFQMPIAIGKPEDHTPDKLVVLKEANVAPEQAPTPAPVATPADPAKEPDTSVGSPNDAADLLEEDEASDSDNYIDGDAYQDDGPPLESEMEDAAEVLARAQSAALDKPAVPVAAAIVTTPEAATVAVAEPVNAQTPTPTVPEPVGAPTPVVPPQAVTPMAPAAIAQVAAPVAPIPAVVTPAAPTPVEAPAEEVAVGV